MRLCKAVRTAVFALVSVLSVGCYSMTPIEGAAPAPGNDVRLALSDEGSVRMAPLIGPRINAIDGRSVETSDTAYVLAVHSVVGQGGRTMTWSQERLAVPRNAVSSVRMRTLDARRTWLAAGLTVVTAFALGQAFGMGEGFDGLLGGGGSGGRK